MAEQQMMNTIDGRVSCTSRVMSIWERPLFTVRCAGCGTVMAYGNDEPRAVTIAVHNGVQRPCCDLWTTS
jgi:hypothetical protein